MNDCLECKAFEEKTRDALRVAFQSDELQFMVGMLIGNLRQTQAVESKIPHSGLAKDMGKLKALQYHKNNSGIVIGKLMMAYEPDEQKNIVEFYKKSGVNMQVKISCPHGKQEEKKDDGAPAGADPQGNVQSILGEPAS